MRRKFIESWSPLVGAQLSDRMLRSHLPLVTIAIALGISWCTGVALVSVNASWSFTDLGYLNVLPAAVVAWLAAQHRIRRLAAVTLAREGIHFDTDPVLLTPRAFTAWSEREALNPELVHAVLSACDGDD